MLPRRLRVENFGSFRAPTEIDFTGADYFALVGPTGAGKSTVIDAICFALYGTVPRWGRENVVGLALPPSAALGRVGLIFEVGGRRYAAVRVLTRDRKGRVSTREARLDELTADGEWDAVVQALAEGEGVSTAVQEIVGLPYKYFVQSVVVPQGRFAEFLHAPPRERQDLLVQLLDAGVYERVRQRAAAEEEACRRAATMAREQLDTLADANEAAELAAERHHDTLTELAGAVRSALDDLARYEDELRGSRAELATARERLRALTALTPPTALAELADRIRSAAGDVRQLTAALAERTAEETTAEEESAAAGDPAVLERIHAGHAERGRLAAELDHAENRLVEASEAKIGLADLLAQADTEHAEAAANLDQARHLNVAADLASRLTVGEPCPVCLRPVDALPHHPAIVEVTEYEGRVRLRGLQVDRLTTGHRDAEVLCGRLEQTCVDLRSRLGSLDEMLADEPDAAAIEQRLKVIESLRERVDRARADTRAARTAHDGAANRLAALQATAERTWQALDEARDTVAALRPPVPARDDPAAAWQALLAWREETVVAQEEDVEALADAVGWTEAAADELRASIITRLSAVGLDVAGDASPVGIGGTVTAAVATARAELTRIRDNRRRAEDLKVRADRADYEARMARELARLLRANNFERWLVTEALAILIEAAAEILRELSGGQYELSLGEQGEIEVIDYSEAGLRRSARTLSGGETFQAGLALALALAQRVAGFAAAAARSLDAIFLDEGFGTLDAAALDTVAATLERLAASGDRMVGVVTHVPALAERVPVRFEVSRDGSGSRIIRRS